MEYNKPLSDALQKKDISSIRAALITYVDLDATASPLVALQIADEVNKKVQAWGMRLFEEDNGRQQLTSAENADPDMWNSIKASMRINFSREKIAFATDIVNKLRQKNVHDFSPQRITSGMTYRRASEVSQYNACSSFAKGFSKPLKDAIAAEDVSSVRAAIITQADTDFFDGTAYALEFADEADRLLREKGKKLFVADNGSIKIENTEWNETIWNKTKAALRINFSREKLDYANTLVKQHHIATRPHRNVAVSSDNQTYVGGTPGDYSYGHRDTHSSRSVSTSRPHISMQRGKSNSHNSVVAGVVVGVVVGGVVGIAVGAPVAGAVIGGAIVGGVTLYKKQ